MRLPLPRLRVSLGSKLALVSLALLALPWAGYRYVREMERFLLEAQQSSLLGSARAVATALHERPLLLGVRPDESALRQQAEEELQRLAAARGKQATNAQPAELEPQEEESFEEVAAILRGLNRASSRIWVVDKRYRVIALAGGLKPKQAPAEQPAWRGWMEAPLSWLMPPPPDDFDDTIDADLISTAQEISAAFLGAERTGIRLSADGKVAIVSAAHPIWADDQVIGAVVAEETTNTILAARNAALERLLLITLVVFALVALALLGFASRLSWRIRHLRDEADSAIDAQGRIKGLIAGSRAGDEVGDLSRSFSRVLARLSEHHGYLEGMASRLSHELRTPIAVVRSSLENLRLADLPQEAGVYLDRANQGLGRLTTILTRMSEATRLEQSLSVADRERYDLAAVVIGCVEGYRQVYGPQGFELRVAAQPIPINGAPDLAAQMLDKLVANAVDFARPGSTVRIVLEPLDGRVAARLAVSNLGPPLPEEMRDRLFHSMVSVRKERGGREPHLGVGLYVARMIAEFHGGKIGARTLAGGVGVELEVILPQAAQDMPDPRSSASSV